MECPDPKGAQLRFDGAFSPVFGLPGCDGPAAEAIARRAGQPALPATAPGLGSALLEVARVGGGPSRRNRDQRTGRDDVTGAFPVAIKNSFN